MIQLTFVYILYSLYILCMYRKYTKAISIKYNIIVVKFLVDRLLFYNINQFVKPPLTKVKYTLSIYTSNILHWKYAAKVYLMYTSNYLRNTSSILQPVD